MCLRACAGVDDEQFTTQHLVGGLVTVAGMKDYPSRFALCGLPITKVDINFDSEKKTIGKWEIK